MSASVGPGLCIGVDGGASKTRVVVLNGDGRCLGERIGPASSLNGHAAQAWPRIRQLVAAIAPDMAWATAHVVVGIAGIELEAARARFLAEAPPAASLEVLSDAHTACLGAHDLGDGAIVSIGTGVIGFATRSGQTHRVAGWGFPHDDAGSGAWLGLAAVSHGLAAADGRCPADALSAAVLAPHAGDATALSQWACNARAGDFAALAPCIVAAADNACPAAVALLNRAAVQIDAIITALAAGDSSLPLALTGGLADTLAPRLGPASRAGLVAPRYSPAMGAARRAEQHASH